VADGAGMAEYKVQFEVFEGPLDLLLYLVKKEEVDIYRVNLTKLATQFMEYVELMREFDLDIAGEFLVMAATLMYIKSRELLPVDQQVQAEGGEDEEQDPRWELIRRLVEYKKFKDAAAQLQALEIRQEGIYPRRAPKLQYERPAIRPEVSLFDLVGAVNVLLKRFQQRVGTRDILEDKWTVSGKIEFIREVVRRTGAVGFFALFAGSMSRSEVVATFLALLELIRLRQVVAVQAHPFGAIQISAAPLPAAPPATPAEQTPAAAGETGPAAAPAVA
jgi:segregation and condensation protein A